MQLVVRPVNGLPLIGPGDNLAQLIWEQARQSDNGLEDDDIVVVAQKIVSKSEGRQVQLGDVQPSTQASELAAETEKDSRLVELILQESTEIVRKKPGVLIVRHRLGHVGANAGIDQSNINHEDGDSALLLPLDPDGSAREIRTNLEELCGKRIGVIICDSVNRPWRLGSVGIAIGASNVPVLDDRRGGSDLYGRELHVTIANHADAVAAAACLVMGETHERVPVAVVKGLTCGASDESASTINRPVEDDLFR